MAVKWFDRDSTKPATRKIGFTAPPLEMRVPSSKKSPQVEKLLGFSQFALPTY